MFARKCFATGAVALTAVALVACSPPNQQDSTLKVETATGVARPATNADAPGYIDCVSAPVQRPSEISLQCSQDNDHLVSIEWDKWEEDSASGWGNRTVTSTDGTTVTDNRLSIELSDPVETSQGLVFSTVLVDGQEPAF
ncbi:putative secreted protein [Corynebacterium deserti GIMN1.010]|uniref:Putative secreted protein n=1 Tax=Corynebacterium deserti GIMN1.010 TaxID=931089 RepID=A0A0M4CD79_9CORY|nr:hypothetical protein [Corynebacterium deserti]ALC05404.1 putative secreted protein [Corynebacterium deserti GIMN1.010]